MSIVIEKCVFCKHHTKTDKRVLGNYKSFCKAFPDGDGIPDQVMDQGYDVICGNGYKFEPRDALKNRYSTERS